MATSTLVLSFTYENGNQFRLQTNDNGAGNVTIIDLRENGDIGTLFDAGIEKALQGYLEGQLKRIVVAMKG